MHLEPIYLHCECQFVISNSRCTKDKVLRNWWNIKELRADSHEGRLGTLLRISEDRFFSALVVCRFVLPPPNCSRRRVHSLHWRRATDQKKYPAQTNKVFDCECSFTYSFAVVRVLVDTSSPKLQAVSRIARQLGVEAVASSSCAH